jgi:phenylacetate-coenzyme A ligase PaaK-like adenylate-forming protein
MRDAAESGESVLLLGTALSLLHAVRSLERTAAEPLPMGSRVMETGGFKGTGREIGRAELYDRIARATGVPPARIVSEYGMTELLSQLYTPVLSEGTSDPVVHVAPPWLVVRALEPMTLEELPEGEAGLLVFYDLANAGSVSHVLTEDIGSVVAGRVRLHGRVRGAEPRGCSRAMDELMSSAGARR